MPVARVLACKSTAEHCNHEARVRVGAETKKPDRRLGTLMQQPLQKGPAARKAPLARHDFSASIDSVASAIPSDADGAQSPTQPSAVPSTKTQTIKFGLREKDDTQFGKKVISSLCAREMVPDRMHLFSHVVASAVQHHAPTQNKATRVYSNTLVHPLFW